MATDEDRPPSDSRSSMAHETEPDPGAAQRHERARAQRREREPRPLIERIGLAAIALVIALLFGGVAIAAFAGGEPFLGVMGAIGALMTVWVGAVTLIRG